MKKTGAVVVAILFVITVAWTGLQGIFDILGLAANWASLMSWLDRVPGYVPWILALLLGAALYAAISGKIEPADTREPHPHDLSLLAQFRAIFSLRTRRFLRDQGFGTLFRMDSINLIHDFVEDWRGAEFEFHDRRLQSKLQDVWNAASRFSELMSARAYATDYNLQLATMKTDQDLANGVSQLTLDKIKEAETLAGILVAAVDKFERKARSRIRVA